jgi:polar amino acid transport system substrate-binding protein
MKGKLMKPAIVLLLAAMLAIPLVAGCGGVSGQTLQPGKLTMGSDTSYPPFESMEGTKPVGFDVEVAQAIAKKMGVTLDVIPTAWDGIIPGLKTKKYDVIMSAMTITPDRQKQINFSNPYIDSDQSLAVANTNTTIKSPADLKGKVVGVQIDTTGQTKAEELQPKVGIKEIQKFDTILVAFEALEQGKIDAIINDYPVNMYVSGKRGKTKVVTKIKTNEQYGIGIRKDNTALVTSINNALKAVQNDGTYATIYKKWFGVAPPVAK